jgi:preprotein translocase subunit YajC
MLESFLLFAQETKDDAPPGGLFNNPLVMLLPIFVLFYFLMIRPMRKQEQQRQSLIGQTKKGDKIITNAGIIGTVAAISDTEDEVTVKVDDNVRLKMIKSSIARNLTQEEAGKATKGQTENKT